MKRKIFKILTTFILLSTLIGTVGALNGWFGGGGSIPEDTFTRGLVAYWSFDEGSGNTAYDASGNGNHGTLINGPKWTQGKIGGALSFDGVDDYVNVGHNESVNITNAITIEAWVMFLRDPVKDRYSGIVGKTYADWKGYNIQTGPYTGKLLFTLGSGSAWISASGNTVLTTGRFYHVVGTFDGRVAKLYINGVLDGSVAYSGTIAEDPTKDLLIGQVPDGTTKYVNAIIDEVRIYNRALSPEEIRFHYSRGGPVAYWKFDEGQGTKVYDLSGNNNNGTLNLGTSGNTDPSKAWVPGKFGSALSFDGVDDYVDVGNPAILNITNAITIEAWVKPIQNGQQGIISGSSYYGGSYALYLRNTPGADVGFWFNNGTQRRSIIVGTVPSNVWTHIVGVADATKMVVYINGIPYTGTLSTGSEALNYTGVKIGYVSWIAPPRYFNGLIDEVRIYNYARTPDEIRLDYNAGYAARFGPSTDCNSDPGSCMTKGLVAYWSFDEGSGNIAYDASGNGNHGTLTNGPKWSQGKIGQALSFDGVDDYVEKTSPTGFTTDEYTVIAWIKFTQLGSEAGNPRSWFITNTWWGPIFSELSSSNKLLLRIGNSSQKVDILSNYTFDKNWHHIALIAKSGSYGKIYVDGVLDKQQSITQTFNVSDFVKIRLGHLWPSSVFRGLIDEVRIYNRALSEEEIRYHYNHTLPKGALSPLAMKEDPSLVGYWSFNEGNGTIISDQSGKNNNGTLYLGSSGNTDPSKAWSPGISGTALSFDGVDDYVRVPASPSLVGTVMSVELWYNQFELRHMGLVGQYYNDSDRWVIGTDPANSYKLGVFADGSFRIWADAVASNNTWYHVVVVWDGSLLKMYVNGKLQSSTSTYNPFTIASGATTFIGVSWYSNLVYARWHKGLIDEVRIYNRALSEQEILEHYRNSKYYLASHFGPKTNCREDPGSCIDYGLVGYWSFDEGAGTTAYDASGKGNNGTIYGAKWTQGALAPSKSGAFGTGLSFDGVDDYVRVSSSASLKIDTSITLSMWFRAASLPSGVWKVPLVKGGGDQDYSFQINPDNTLMWWANDLSPSAVPFGTITTGIWYHAVAVYDKNLGKIFVYLNGTLKNPDGTSVTGSITHNDLPLDIGSMGGLYPFNGLIDEVRIYNRALSEEEIRYLYNRGAPIAHWKFDEGKGNIAYDSSGNGNNGTIYGAQWVQGKFGSALSFDGVDDYVETSLANVPSGSSPFTISLWINPLANKSMHLVWWGESVSGKLNHLDLRTTDIDTAKKIRHAWYGNDFSVNVDWQVNSWQHIVVTWDGTYRKIYYNGNLLGTQTPPTPNVTATTVKIAKINSGVSGTWYNGLIDDVRIYNYARSPEQILQDYNAGLSTHFK